MKINFDRFIRDILQDKKKLALAIILIAIFIYVDFFLIWKMQISALKRVNLQIAQIKIGLNNLKSDLAQMSQSGSRIAVSKTKKSIFEDQISWLIEEIYKLGKANNVGLVQLRPGGDVAKEGITTSPGLKATPFLLSLELSSGYHQLVRFIEALESHPVFLSMNSLGIERDKKDIFVQQVKLTLITYVSKR